jgi:hypothetical protein
VAYTRLHALVDLINLIDDYHLMCLKILAESIKSFLKVAGLYVALDLLDIGAVIT